MGATVRMDVELVTISCGECGGVYAITERYRRQCHDEARSWNCPYCKIGWGWGHGKTAAQKEREKAEALQRRLAREEIAHHNTKAELEHTEARRRGEKAAKTRLKKRAAGGACPCCNRTFENLARHMKSKHPDFAEAKSNA